MKYIVYLDSGTEYMVVFPKNIDHNKMADCIEVLRFGGDHNWHRRQGEVVSAGFVEGGQCIGRSETLDIKSRPEDTGIYLSDGTRAVNMEGKP